MLLLKTADKRRKYTAAHRDGGPHPNGLQPRRRVEIRLHLVIEGQQLPGISKQTGPRLGDVQLLRQPVEQQHAVFLFQVPDRLADGGLGDVQLPGGLSHLAGFSHRLKNLQMPDRHRRPPFSSIIPVRAGKNKRAVYGTRIYMAPPARRIERLL